MNAALHLMTAACVTLALTGATPATAHTTTHRTPGQQIAAAQARTGTAPSATTLSGTPRYTVTSRGTRHAYTANPVDLIAATFTANQVGHAIAIARCESGLLPTAIGPMNNNGTTDWGLFQFNDGGTLQETLRRVGIPFTNTAAGQQLALDPRIATMLAEDLYERRGWVPWACAERTGIVANLWSNNPGPNYGKYDQNGRLTGTPVNNANPASTPPTLFNPGKFTSGTYTIPKKTGKTPKLTKKQAAAAKVEKARKAALKVKRDAAKASAGTTKRR